jgi:hypothetical protein
MKVCMVVMTAILLSACQKQSASSSTNASASAESRATPSRNSSEPGDVKATAGAPVEFTAVGITPDKANVAYRIKVNTAQPIDEVHLALKATDGKGKVSEDTIVWQNIVGSTRRPIENGKVYEDQSALDPATVKADVSLKEVLFKDGSKWNAR